MSFPEDLIHGRLMVSVFQKQPDTYLQDPFLRLKPVASYCQSITSLPQNLVYEPIIANTPSLFKVETTDIRPFQDKKTLRSCHYKRKTIFSRKVVPETISCTTFLPSERMRKHTFFNLHFQKMPHGWHS